MGLGLRKLAERGIRTCCIFCCIKPTRTCPNRPVSTGCYRPNRFKTDETGEGDLFAKPLYGPKPVSRVRIPPSPPDSISGILVISRPRNASCNVLALASVSGSVRPAGSTCSVSRAVLVSGRCPERLAPIEDLVLELQKSPVFPACKADSILGY